MKSKIEASVERIGSVLRCKLAQLGMSGAVTVSDDRVNQRTKVTTSAGTAKVKPLKIMKNGMYSWEAYGEKKSGKWERSGRSDYPVVLKKAIEGKDWLVGEGRKKDQIIVWDGNAYNYTCDRLR